MLGFKCVSIQMPTDPPDSTKFKSKLANFLSMISFQCSLHHPVNGIVFLLLFKKETSLELFFLLPSVFYPLFFQSLGETFKFWSLLSLVPGLQILFLSLHLETAYFPRWSKITRSLKPCAQETFTCSFISISILSIHSLLEPLGQK